jgi:molybdopterin-guanine dinucleotide biosynthesis protein A
MAVPAPANLNRIIILSLGATLESGQLAVDRSLVLQRIGHIVESSASQGRLLGLVLAGGRSRRMGEDKGGLRYHGDAQALVAWRLLNSVCGQAFVSVRAGQTAVEPYADLPCIVDVIAGRGPAVGLESAWRAHPDAAWLTLAVDMPRVTPALLESLVAQRNRQAIATALRHPDGTAEPMCAIWEPAARVHVYAELESGRGSLRQTLERDDVAFAAWGELHMLDSINTPSERAAWQSRAPGRRGSGS